MCAALGADLDVRVRWQGEGLDRIVALLSTHGWQTWLEVTFNEFGERGSIDVFGWHAATRTLLVVEVKSVVPDAQGTLAPLDRKVRLAPKLAHDRGLDPVAVGRLLVIGDQTANRRRVARFDALFAAALPVRGWDVRRWLATPAGTIAGLLFLSDATQGGTRRTATGRARVNPPRRRLPNIE